MLFTSFDYLFFVPILLFLYYLAPSKFKWVVLLIGSYFFYLSFKLQFIPSLIICTIVIFLISRWMNYAKSERLKKTILIIGITLLLSFIFVFKYYDFFSDNLNVFLKFTGISFSLPVMGFILPLGASYYIFLMMGYLIDIYYKKITPAKNIGKFALFVSFFPKLMSGPIERGKSFLPQIDCEKEVKYESLINGLKLFIWGFFKKVVIADRLAEAVNKAFSFPEEYSGITLIIVSFIFSFQLYTDFSGYTDMAIGVSKMFGYNLMDNFKRPFISESISEFWKRWHITLSSWLRDYIFLPIAYAVTRKILKSKPKNIKADVFAYITGIILTMIICGLWHGSKWTFIIWGFIHGIFITIGFLTKKKKSKLIRKLNFNKNIIKFIKIMITFLLISLSFIMFRAETLSSALLIYKKIFLFDSGNSINLLFTLKIDLFISIVCIVFLFLFEYFSEIFNNIHYSPPVILKYYVLVLFLLIVFFGKMNQSDFLYFKF